MILEVYINRYFASPTQPKSKQIKNSKEIMITLKEHQNVVTTPQIVSKIGNLAQTLCTVTGSPAGFKVA